MNKQFEKQMALQLGQMWATGKQWLKDHPGADVKITWNYPPHWHLIKPISNAIKERFISANPIGMALMKALWRWDVASEPSVTMMRVVIESLTEEQEPDLLARVKRMVEQATDRAKIFIKQQ